MPRLLLASEGVRVPLPQGSAGRGRQRPMWRAIEAALKSTPRTLRFMAIITFLAAVMLIVWYLLGASAPGFFASVARML